MNRRNFLRNSALAATLGVSAKSLSAEKALEEINSTANKIASRKSVFNMCGYAAQKTDTLRVGLVGIGTRGTGLLKLLLKIGGVEIAGVCDVRKEAVGAAQELILYAGRKRAEEFFGGKLSWEKLCASGDIDLIINATPWKWHAPICIAAMESGKHAAVEVPAAITLKECLDLVDTSERTKRHCVMLENCCYDFFEAATIQMAQDGLFGDLVSAEGAYIHEIVASYVKRSDRYDGALWRWEEQLAANGNLYPTHGLGPIAWAFGINRGDNFDLMTSMSSDDFSIKAYFDANHAKCPDLKAPYKVPCGNMNVSLIRTKLGRLITLFHDISSPRPYDRKHIISGTKGFAQKYPLPGRLAFSDKFLPQEQSDKFIEEHAPELLRKIGKAAKAAGGHGGMDYIMLWRLADCLRNGLPLDSEVYDAAAWSSLYPLSIASVAGGSNAVAIPDFSGGNWKLNKPVDLGLRGGGSTQAL